MSIHRVMPKTQPKTERKFRPWIHPHDQASLFALAMAALALVVSTWWYQGGLRGGLVEIERATPLEARFLVDINQAQWPELDQLPGIGEMLARRVVEDRQANGAFQDVEDLQRVSGIGIKTLEKIRPFLKQIPKDTDWAALDRESSLGIP